MKQLLTFILASIFSPTSLTSTASSRGAEIASRHSIVRNSPAVDFFDGCFACNGAMGIVVRTRPDAIIIHFGHNNVWDIRISEKWHAIHGQIHQWSNPL